MNSMKTQKEDLSNLVTIYNNSFEELVECDADEEIIDEDEHKEDGSGDYLCDCCDEPVNSEDWCFSCKAYVYVHHIND